MKSGKKYFVRILIAALLILLAAYSAPTPAPTPTPIPLAKEITFYSWAEGTRQSVMDTFTEEYGVKVGYVGYESQEEAIENIKAGKIYDVVVMESRFVPQLIKEKLLAELDQRNLSNTKDLSANFRDLAYDPGGSYSIPNSWGTTGEDLANAELILPLSPQGQKLYDDIWKRFTDAS